MLKEIKDVLVDYVLIGFVFGILSVVWTREPLSTTDKIKKVAASMTLSLIVGSVCKGLNVNDYTIFAIIGGSCCFAREFFDAIGNFMRLLIDRPLQTIKFLINLIRGGNDNDKS